MLPNLVLTAPAVWATQNYGRLGHLSSYSYRSGPDVKIGAAEGLLLHLVFIHQQQSIYSYDIGWESLLYMTSGGGGGGGGRSCMGHCPLI